MNERGPWTGHLTQPRQEPSTVVTIESIEHTDVRVTGLFAVTVPDAVWRNRPAFGDLETEIAEAIRAVLQQHAINASADG